MHATLHPMRPCTHAGSCILDGDLLGRFTGLSRALQVKLADEAGSSTPEQVGRAGRGDQPERGWEQLQTRTMCKRIIYIHEHIPLQLERTGGIGETGESMVKQGGGADRGTGEGKGGERQAARREEEGGNSKVV